MTSVESTTLAGVLAQARKGASSSIGEHRRKLGEVLIEEHLISHAQLMQALRAQSTADRARRRLGMVVADLGFASELAVATALADHLGLIAIDLSRVASDPTTVRLLPRHLAERTGVLMLGPHPGGGIVVATADPTNVVAIDDVRMHTRATDVFVVVATASGIRDHLRQAWSLSEGSEIVTLATEMTAVEEKPVDDINPSDAPIVRMVNEILLDAARLNASDIHIEPQRQAFRIRYRVDGLLREVTSLPRNVGNSVVSRIKIMAGMDIAQRRVPQDGRTQISTDAGKMDTRISTLPSVHGEKVVIRLLTRSEQITSLDSLGFDDDQLVAFRKIMQLPQGLVLITGPTGSGKTNTLYAAIAESNTADRNIVTLEDPVEVQLPGITQVHVNPKAGLTFESGLRSILRQDPDTILVGEVRDPQTAELSLKAAITGHLVYTTLHTSSAAGALTRLVDMGVEPFLVATSLSASIAQRLVRRPCSSCVEPYIPEDEVLTALGLTRSKLLDATPRRGTGCQECGQSGYAGRTAVYEVLIVDAAMRRVLLHTPTEGAVLDQVNKSGMRTLRQQAIAKALAGLTTFEEALRVTAGDVDLSAGS